MALIHFRARSRFQLVQQIVRLDAQSLAAADFNVRFLRIFLAQRVAQFARRSAA